MTTPADEDEEWGELLDASFPRVDLVSRGANGVPRFLIAKSDGGGLLEPGFVRSLIGKEAVPVPAETREDTVTMTGSPAAIAKLMREGAIGYARPDTEAIAKAMDAYPADPVDVAKSKAVYDLVVKAKYSAEDRRKMAGHEAMEDGSYPVKDEADLDDAIHAVGRGGASHDAIRRHVIARAKALGKSSKIPDNWAADGSLEEKVSKDMADMGPDLDDGTDGMDPTVPLAAPGEMGPGDPTDPGSPAWESIDAATAQKWTSIAVRLRNALCVMAEREMVEAATADAGDAEAAWDLQDAMCAVDYVIDTLAGFAVGEQAEAELATEMEAIGKALASFDAGPLETFEGLATVAKAGRVLSTANEGLIREAAGNLQRVLATLPQAPAAEEVTKEKEAAVPADQTKADAAPAQETPVAKGEAPAAQEAPAAAPAPVAKADGDGEKPAMQAVFDQNGDLIGIVDPSAITPVAGASKPPADADDGAQPEAAPAPDAGDMTPEPAAQVGTPADGVAKEEAAPAATTQDVLTSIVTKAVSDALAAQEAAHQEAITKMAGERAGELEELRGRLETVEKSPAAPKVFTNGQVPPANMLRGQDQGAVPVDVAKARDLKDTLYHGTAREQNEAHAELERMAVAKLQQMHATRR